MCEMSEEKFAGFLLGLLVASYICEARAKNRASHNAMAIMQYRTNTQLMAEQGHAIPGWNLQ